MELSRFVESAPAEPCRNGAKILMLNGMDVLNVLAPDDVIHAVREAFILHSKGAGKIFPVVREALDGGGVFGIKSGAVPSQKLLGFKAAGFWPANRRLGGEPHQATVLLFDPDTGRPLCVLDGNAITTARTGAAGALALEMLCRPESTFLCVFGSGVQASVQVNYALRTLPNISHIRYLTVDQQASPEFERKFSPRCKIVHSLNPNVAVEQSDIVITATPGFGPLFDANAVRPGTHLNCVGADTRGKRELPDGLLQLAKVFADDREQATSIGELQWMPETPMRELGDLVSGSEKFERAPEDITVMDMTGIALQDLTVARLVYEKARASNMGCDLAWPW